MIRLFSRNKNKENISNLPPSGSSGKKICIFGGTFDPIHLGHMRMAAKAAKIFSLDRMIFMPSGSSYLKSNVTEAGKRLEMTRLSAEDFKADKNSGYYDDISNCEFSVSDLEINRDGKTYTYETLEEMRRLYPGDTLYFLVGEDSIRHMESWVNPQIIFADAVIIAATRPAKRKQDFDSSCHEVYEATDRINEEQADFEHIEDLQARLMKMYPAEIHLMNFDDPLSSHNIRTAVANGEAVDGMVTASVSELISKYNLYR